MPRYCYGTRPTVPQEKNVPCSPRARGIGNKCENLTFEQDTEIVDEKTA